MGDSRNEKGYEMAPQSEPDPEKGGADGEIAQSEWTGLGKEELLRVADTPGWNWARNILLILFWVGWLAMLVAAIIIVVRVPRCPEVEWFEKSVVYQAYPRSLKDSDGDGVGDLKGVEQQLDHLANISASVIYLNSIYRERNVSSSDGGSVNVGYDIVDFKNVDESLGSLEDFESLMAAATAKEMKVVLEFVPNHSSDEHPWFEDSRMSQDSEYADFYVWADGVDASSPPNDWKNAYGESAWNWNADRQQFYYAYFGPKLPDFNYNNKSLCEEIESILSFWLTEYKVDGFVFSHVDYLFEPPITTVADGVRRRRQAGTTGAGGETMGTTPGAEPEPATSGLPSKEMPPQYDFVGGNSETQKQLFGLLESWRQLLNDNSYLGKYRLMVTQSEGPVAEVAKLYGQNKTRLADYPLNTGFLDTFDGALSGSALATGVENWMKAKENLNNQNRWNTWMLGCHDRSRISDRAGADYVDALNFMLLTLPGTPFVYYGEEIGMKDVAVATDPQDKVPNFYPSESSRDPFRTPMPWTDATNAGFTWENATAYLPLPDDAADNNVQAQLMEEFSNLNILKELAQLHTEPSLVAGKFEKIVADDNVFAYVRSFGEWPRYLVVINVGEAANHNLYDLGSGSKPKLPMEGRIVLSTSGEARSGKMKKNGKRKGTKESLTNIKTMKGEALLIKF